MKCPRCGTEHGGKVKQCDYCRSVWSPTAPIQSVSEGEQWQDHVEDHKHENDYLSDGGWVDN